jgi:two-component system cell cycle sensor histidine kinase/response regulator CckA
VVQSRRILERLLGAHIALEIVDESSYSVKIDSTQFDQVLFNLTINAADAMPKGGVLEIRVSDLSLGEPRATPRGLAPAGDYVMLEVGDEGHGISADDLTRIFEPFFTTKEIGKGTGIGLSTVLDIVQHAGGFIDVRSTPGAGSTFVVLLPRAAGTSGVKTKSLAELRMGSGETLLLVEDDALVREVSTTGPRPRRLHRAGYRRTAKARSRSSTNTVSRWRC